MKLERLEDRITPAVYLDTANVLHASVDTRGGTHTVVATPGANAGDVTITIDGKATSFTGVAALELRGAVGGKNYVENDTSLPSTETGVGVKDTIFGGKGPDTINAGKGDEILYDLLGTNTVNAKNGRIDRIFTNAASTVNADAKDTVVNFFAANRLPGAGTVIVENGVLYLTPPNGVATTTQLDATRTGYRLTYNWGNGVQTQTFTKDQVKILAFFGGSGGNTFINNTRLSQASYGGSGSDLLVGGFGSLDIIKGLGGSDVLVGRAYQNDLSNSGSSVSDAAVDYLFGLGTINVFRAGPEDFTFASAGSANVFLNSRAGFNRLPVIGDSNEEQS